MTQVRIMHYGAARTELDQLLIRQPRHPGQPVSRENMLDVVWGYTRFPTTRTIDTHIWRLRKKLGDDGDSPRWIRPVHGQVHRGPAADGEPEQVDPLLGQMRQHLMQPLRVVAGGADGPLLDAEAGLTEQVDGVDAA